MEKEQLLYDYISEHTTKEDDILHELYRETHLKVLHPRMISGHVQGKFLELLSTMISPTRILEIGTYTGYSAICLAKGLKKEGKLYSIDKNDELKELAQKYINKAGFTEKIELITGNALEEIDKLSENFDLVFIDGNKDEYVEYFIKVFDKVVEGGYIIADNVLWNQKVLHKTMEKDYDTKAIKEFNDLIYHNAKTENVIVPIRDGLNIIRKH